MAWSGNVLRVNLTQGTCISEPLNMEWARDYIGQRGLATRYFVEEVDPKVEPLAPENHLIFANGPLTGTMASTGGRYSVITKGPLTGAIACSNSGGFLGAELRSAGWDMVIFEGKSPRPVYLYIEDERAELRSAEHIWGKSVWETDEILHKKHQDPRLRIAACGRAAEVGCFYASIINDLHRAAGRSGVGAVMASKNLKALAVRGNKGVGNVKDPPRFLKETAKHKKVLAEHGVTGSALPTYGTQVLMNIVNEIGALPANNMRDVQFDGAHRISGEQMTKPRPGDGKPNLTRKAACFGCTIACGRISTVEKGHFTVENKPEYWGNSGGLEYEAAWALGADTGVDDLDAMTYANFICNEDGFDPISFGATVAAAMELFEKGAITTEHTGGMELNFGSAKALAWAAEQVATGEGFGADLGLGSKRLCEKYGDPDLSMTVKGQEFPAYDPRAIQGMGLTYATSNRGACHLRSYTVSQEVLGLGEKAEPHDLDGKPKLVRTVQDVTAAWDSTGLCLFTSFAWTLDNVAPQMDAACEGEWTSDRLLEAGERIWNLERDFNIKAGFTSADDTLPKRLLEEPAGTGPAKGLVSGVPKMMPEYYRERGWTVNGEVTDAIRTRLGLPA